MATILVSPTDASPVGLALRWHAHTRHALAAAAETSAKSTTSILPRVLWTFVSTDDKTSATPDLLGSQLGHFRIVEKLGEGGMGVVYKAVDETLRRTVALKVLPPLYAASEERRARFMREARSAAAITHANVASVYEVGAADGRIFIAMEFVEGQSLRGVVSDRALPVAHALHLARGIARALAKAHEKGIVHRDL